MSKSGIAQAYVGIGSNLNKPVLQTRSACRHLAEHPDIELIAESLWYRSKAVGPGIQPDYINGVTLLATPLSPLDLLAALLQIEYRHKRERQQRWGPRTLDLDLLLYNGATLNSDRLTLPHPRLIERNFVMRPLLDINPDLSLPDGRKIADILHIIGTQDLHQVT